VQQAQSIKLIAGFSLFTKFLVYFLSVIYWLTLVLKPATKSSLDRCASLSSTALNDKIL